MNRDADRVGVLVVRIWIDRPSGSLRARLTRTLDVSARNELSEVATTEEQVIASVRDWVSEFVGRKTAS